MVAVPKIAPLDVDILPMHRRHLQTVLRIEESVYPQPWTRAIFVGELSDRSTRTYYVARVGRHIAGYAGLLMQADDAHITTLAVDPQWQRASIGTRLMLALAREALWRRAQAMTLEVRVANKGAQELYRRFDFRPVGVRKNYYPETKEDALIMWAHDIQDPEYRELLNALESQTSGTTTVKHPKRWWQP